MVYSINVEDVTDAALVKSFKVHELTTIADSLQDMIIVRSMALKTDFFSDFSLPNALYVF